MEHSARLSGISVCIATHNREIELRRTLATLSRLDQAGAPDYEILVIANNCTDSTIEVVTQFEQEYPQHFRHVEESVPGLSRARNRAIAEARFEIIAFLDDDVDVDPKWLAAVWSAFQQEDPAAVGGAAHLLYPIGRPSWLSDRREGLLTRVDLGRARCVATYDELYGLNLSIRREWFERVGTFRTDLGRIGTRLISSEEAELLHRIANAGGVLLYEPDAIVGHRVPESRLRRGWFWSRTYWGQIGDARMLPPSQLSAYSFVRSIWRVARAAVSAASACLARGPHSAHFFDQSLTLVARWGDCVGLCSQLRRSRVRLLSARSVV